MSSVRVYPATVVIEPVCTDNAAPACPYYSSTIARCSLRCVALAACCPFRSICPCKPVHDANSQNLPFGSDDLLETVHHTSVPLTWFLDTRLQLDSSLDHIQRIHDKDLGRCYVNPRIHYLCNYLPQTHQPPHLNTLARALETKVKHKPAANW